MFLRELTEKNSQLLNAENFSAYIKNLYELGVRLENDFVQAAKNLEEGTFPQETCKKQRFFRYIEYYFRFKYLIFPSEKSLATRLWNLKSFLIAWEDPALRQQDKRLRQSIKLKADIDKSFRQSIHAALIAEVIRLQTEVSFFSEQELPAIKFENELTTEQLNIVLINCLRECIYLLSSEIPEHIDQTYDQAANAIASFKPKADKFLHGLSIIIGLLAALACGLATGGFLFLLVSGFGAPLGIAILAGSLMFVASTYANFGLFSAHCSRFLRTCAKSGSITEFFDENGQRKQLSVPIKCLLALGALLSIGVGLSSASLTIMFGMALIAMLFPHLAMIVPAILIGALVFGMTIGLSLIIFKAWVYLVNVIRTKFSCWGDFSECLLKQFKAIKNLTVTQFLGYLFQIAFISFALFGLFFLCFTGIPSLVPAFTPIGSWIVGLAAFLGDLPFTIITVSSFCSSFMQWFARADSSETSEREGLASPVKRSLLTRIAEGVMLVANAVGRSIQVFNGKLISVFAALACFFSALAGTLLKADNPEENSRNQANQTNKDLLIQDDYKIVESTLSVVSDNPQRHSKDSSCAEFFSAVRRGSSSSPSEVTTECVSAKFSC